MKTLKHFAMMLVLLTMGFAFSSCSDDDEPFTDLASRVEGEYIGTLKPIGYTDEPARAYVSLVRVADDAVSFKCTCEAFDIDPDPRNLVIEERSGGVYYLTSESTYVIEGSASGNSLSITFAIGDIEWFFSGSK